MTLENRLAAHHNWITIVLCTLQLSSRLIQWQLPNLPVHKRGIASVDRTHASLLLWTAAADRGRAVRMHEATLKPWTWRAHVQILSHALCACRLGRGTWRHGRIRAPPVSLRFSQCEPLSTTENTLLLFLSGYKH